MNGKEVRLMQPDFEQVYEQYYNVVYRYLLSLTKDKHLAEDFTQETFYKALKSIDTYNPEMKMLSWLCAIAKNTYFTWAKRHKRQQHLSEIDEVYTDDIIDRLIDSEDTADIYKALHSLNEPYKEVFTLRVLGNLPFAKIGELFGKTESWARVTFFRAKSMIKERMNNG